MAYKWYYCWFINIASIPYMDTSVLDKMHKHGSASLLAYSHNNFTAL